MRPVPRFGLVMVTLLLAAGLRADVRPEWLHQTWAATWITHPQAALHEFGVFRFRKVISLPAAPTHFVVHVSGDRRYRLFANGQPVSAGPQRSDPWHWHFETVDLAAQLHAGENVLAAEVWNYGDDGPYALLSAKTAFILQGDGADEAMANSDSSWRVMRDPSISAERVDAAALHTFLVTGPGDHVDGAAYPWNWAVTPSSDATWVEARQLEPGHPAGVGTDAVWGLVPRTLPAMEERPQVLGHVRRSEGIQIDTTFLSGHAPVEIPARTRGSVLLDQDFETIAFPRLRVSGGRGARLRVTYAEALVDQHGEKGNRSEIEGRHIVGVSDVFLPDGGENQTFSTLTFRTFRFVQIDVQTADQPLKLEEFSGTATGYPLDHNASFSSDDASLGKIWDVGWHTARLCAYETYTDCPYYEQLQYVGDTRIQALITLTNSRDDRLVRNAIELFDESRLPNGLTQSRYPSTVRQIIPPFSLFWVQMVHDFDTYRNDPEFVKARLFGIRGVLHWFEDRIDPHTHLLGPMPYWCFVDWTDAWSWKDDTHPGGQPAGTAEGGSAVLSLQLAWTLSDAADLFETYGDAAEATRTRELARSLRTAVMQACWDPSRSLLSDTPERKIFSQHANALAVLSGAVTGDAARALMQRTIRETDLIQCSLYFRYYLLRAAKLAGLGDVYLENLGPWKDMLARGLTTFAEKPDPTRSDCHAWSASPSIDLLSTVCGIEPASRGFASVRIAPHLGGLTHVAGRMPHPNGDISVTIDVHGTACDAEIVLPPGLAGTFEWKRQTLQLHSGAQRLTLQNPE